MLQGYLVEAAAGVEPAMEVLQTSALPLGYAAVTRERVGPSDATPDPCTRKAGDRGWIPQPLPWKVRWSG